MNSIQSITCLAAVAWEPRKPLEITSITVAAPQQNEVRLKILSNALCHTDVYTLDGYDPEGLFPCILGHEAVGLVESIGPNVKSVEIGDMVIPCYTPECQEFDCVFCQSDNTNLCPKIRATQGKGLMPDGTSRFSKDGKIIYHFMGCSTFSEYTVVAEISVAKISKLADPYKMCLLGCGISTGWGAAYNTSKVTYGSSVAVFGLGAVGLAVIQACKQIGARSIIGVDVNVEKFELAKKFGCNECFNPVAVENKQDIKDVLLAKEKWGYDFTFDCTGNVQVMRTALEVAHRGFGVSCIIGVAASGHEIQTRPFQLVTGRVWKGTAFGGWKSRTEVPKLVKKVLRGELNIDQFITHNYKGLEKVNESIEALHSGKCLRGVIHIAEEKPTGPNWKFHLLSKVRCFEGYMMRFKHWSEVCKCEMHFSVYIPDKKPFKNAKNPVLYFLAGLTCTDENAPAKSGFQKYASEHGIVVVCPDTSPRGVLIEGIADHWDFGVGAGFYLDATEEKYKKHYNMASYITKELPFLMEQYFDVDMKNQGLIGHSMGGHGALVTFLRNPNKYTSVSALSPICNPINCPWGIKAFTGYLGNVENGKEYDACELMKSYQGNEIRILVSQGSEDKFLKEELKPLEFQKVCEERKYPLTLRMNEHFDHSYYFVASVMEEHFKHHAKNFGI